MKKSTLFEESDDIFVDNSLELDTFIIDESSNDNNCFETSSFENATTSSATTTTPTSNIEQTKKKTKRGSIALVEDKFLETMENFNSFLKKPRQSNENDEDGFVRAVSGIINTLQPRNKIRARSEILACISKIQLDELNQT